MIRIRPQATPQEPVADLIEDPWRVLPCPPNATGCSVELGDPDFAAAGRDARYYVRAIQEPSATINGDPLRCERDAAGACLSVHPCYGGPETE